MDNIEHPDDGRRLWPSVAKIVRSLPDIIKGALVVAGAIAIFWQPLHDMLYPPDDRYGKILQVKVMEPMTLGEYLTRLDASKMSNSIGDAQHSDADKKQLGSRVTFYVEVAGYYHRRCDIAYEVHGTNGTEVVPESLLVNFKPDAKNLRLAYDLWIPHATSSSSETLEVKIYDDSPRPPGNQLDSIPEVVAWE